MPFFIPALIFAEEIIQVAVVLTAAAGAANAAERIANREPAPSWSTQTTTTHTPSYRTIYDWWGNGLAGYQRDYLLQLGYSDSGSTYSLIELKGISKYHERQLLTEQSQTYIQIWIDENDYSSSEERDRRERVVNCSKRNSPVWKGMKHYRDDIKTNGRTGDKKRFYRWDNTHNDIEVYDRRGRHLGSMDPRTGVMYKGPDSTNSISDLL